MYDGFMRCLRAFSLIELLVVIAIIALLVSLTLPALSGAAAKAKQAKCLAQCQQSALALTAYSQDNKSAFPSVPVPMGLPVIPNQSRYGGLAGFFSLNQVGDGGHVGFTGSVYSNAADVPILRSYFTSLGVLKCPSDREDRYYGNPYGPTGNVSYAAATALRPEPCGKEEDAVSYNISYLYFTGLTSNGHSDVFLWADETNGPDLDGLAWYGPGFPGSTSANSAAAGALSVGRYAPVDNHGTAGGNFALSDGSARWWKGDQNLPPGMYKSFVD